LIDDLSNKSFPSGKNKTFFKRWFGNIFIDNLPHKHHDSDRNKSIYDKTFGNIFVDTMSLTD